MLRIVTTTAHRPLDGTMSLRHEFTLLGDGSCHEPFAFTTSCDQPGRIPSHLNHLKMHSPLGSPESFNLNSHSKNRDEDGLATLGLERNVFPAAECLTGCNALMETERKPSVLESDAWRG